MAKVFGKWASQREGDLLRLIQNAFPHGLGRDRPAAFLEDAVAIIGGVLIVAAT